MKELLHGLFSPLTFKWSFLEAPRSAVIPVFLKWSRTIHSTIISTEISGHLSDLLAKLPPLTGLPRRQLFIDTNSNWTAYFCNMTAGCDWFGTTSYLCQLMKVRGFGVDNIPNSLTERTAKQGKKGVFGGVQFQLYAPHPTDCLNIERTISLIYEGRWRFSIDGNKQPFEKDQYYKAKLTRDKFTSEILEEYCAALGIRLFDAAFYGPDATLAEIKDRLPDGWREFSLEEMQKEIGLL